MARRASRPNVALVVLLVFLAACSSTPTVPASLPRFEPAPSSLQDLVGSTFAGDLPPQLGGLRGDARSAGAAILHGSALVGPTDRVAMHWVITGEVGDFLVTAGAEPAPDGTPRWTVRSAWRLIVAPEMAVTLGTSVCKPSTGASPIEGNSAGFIAITDQEQGRAFAAWTVTSEGPVPYPSADELDCERFTP